MTRVTKTIRVEVIRQRVNHYLASGYPHDGGEDQRHGVANLLSDILIDTGNYRGFGYLESPYQEGVTDETRRYYY
jgi:hypothetical protein